MPKAKEFILEEEEKILDPELVVGDAIDEVEEEDDEAIGLDDDEVDPFKDKWEE
ncbi:MAG TPA: hypothetical protein VJI66_02480 [Candidatus Paceibacterota bacterium]